MSRHRNIRSMNYQDEYDGYDDIYGHSVEDSDVCVSPSTAQEYIFDRTGQHPLASYVTEQDIPEEAEDGEESLNQSSGSFTRPSLSELDEARLNSCLEQMRSVVGESTAEHAMVDAILGCSFDFEKALSAVLNTQEVPKPQRQPRERRPRARSSTGEVPANSVTKQPPPDVTVEEPQPTEPETLVPDTGARLTFASSDCNRSGFTPEKTDGASIEPEASAVAAVKHQLNLDEPSPEPCGSAQVNGVADAATDGATGTGSASLDVPAGGEPPGSPQLTSRRSASNLQGLAKFAPKSKAELLAARAEYEKRKAGGKDCINLVVIGHVDAGKSTLMGHVLYQLGCVNKRTMHKYEQEAKKLGKASFAYAWVLDETEEERTRGVTMDVAQTRFETDTKTVTLLDAPGHKDFIPNMITGAAQADVAILVVNAARGEFETGFEMGGQTREHAMLIRSLGVSQLVVAVNKLDTVDWCQERFKEITKKLGAFLKQAGFRDSDVRMIPCSGLTGQNLTIPPTEDTLKEWYNGCTVIQAIDDFKPPERAVDKPLRMCVGDVFKGMGSGLSLSGTLQAGSVQPGDKIVIMPQGEVATVKSVVIDDVPCQYAFAGDTGVLVVTGIDMTNVSIGSVLCEPSSPIPVSSRIQARVVIFNIDVPLTKGFPVVFHYQSLSEPANIRRLVSQLHKSTGEVVRNKPRCLTKNSNAVIELEISRPLCMELYKDYRDLGRFMLRYAGATIAAGLVTEIKDYKGARTE